MTKSPAANSASVSSRACVRVLRAETPEAALQLAHASQAPFVAGASWLQPVWERQRLWPARVIPVSADWEGFCGVTVNGDCLETGALTTLEGFARNPEVMERLSGLGALVDRIAGPAVRHLGTVGGNLAAGGDLTALALVLNARLHILTGAGWQRISLEDWPGSGSLIRSVIFDIPTGTRVLVEKLGHREAFSPTRITLACARVAGRRRVAVCGEGGAARLHVLEACLVDSESPPGPEQCERALAEMDWGNAGLRRAGGRLMAHLLGALES